MLMSPPLGVPVLELIKKLEYFSTRAEWFYFSPRSAYGIEASS